MLGAGFILPLSIQGLCRLRAHVGRGTVRLVAPLAAEVLLALHAALVGQLALDAAIIHRGSNPLQTG